MRRQTGIAIGLLTILLGGPVRGEPGERPYLDIPIHQTINRGGALRYAIWVKVGDRTVEALLDTGSTGLRVLASVMPGDFSGVPTDMGFGGTLHMQGVVVRTPIEIGSMKGEAPVELVQNAGCVADRPDCVAGPVGGDSFRIGGDAFAHQGYAAILGIGFPFIRIDMENPLEALGVKRWIVQLPRPFEESPGHLILDPGPEALRGFTVLPRHGKADADGCIEGDFLPERKCGTILFDTGAPAISVAYEGVKVPSELDQGIVHLSLALDEEKSLKLDYHVGESGGFRSIRVGPPQIHGDTEAFISGGVSPFLSYDILYDAAARSVALRARSPTPAAGSRGTEAHEFDDALIAPRYRRSP